MGFFLLKKVNPVQRKYYQMIYDGSKPFLWIRGKFLLFFEIRA